jgi:DNA-directed RNA polymerase subunit RPC12/RpoP
MATASPARPQPALQTYRCASCGRRLADADLRPGSVLRLVCKRCGSTQTFAR